MDDTAAPEVKATGAIPSTLIEPEGDGSAPLATWRDQLPDGLKTEPSLAQFKTIEDLSKSYIETKRMVGADKVVKPQEKWDDAKYDEFYDATGRPKEAKDYKFTDEMFAGLQLNTEALENDKKIFHEAGLSQRQATKLMERLSEVKRGAAKEAEQHTLSMNKAAEDTLRAEWGAGYEDQIHIANQTISALGGDALRDEIIKGGYGNNVTMLRVFSQLGKNMSEDQSFGQGPGLSLRDSTRANMEIANLTMDKEFMEAFTNKHAQGHKQAVEKMRSLRKTAHSGS